MGRIFFIRLLIKLSKQNNFNDSVSLDFFANIEDIVRLRANNYGKWINFKPTFSIVFIFHDANCCRAISKTFSCKIRLLYVHLKLKIKR